MAKRASETLAGILSAVFLAIATLAIPDAGMVFAEAGSDSDRFLAEDAAYARAALTSFAAGTGEVPADSACKTGFIEVMIAMVERGYVQAPYSVYDDPSSVHVPEWTKHNVSLWLEGKISDKNFLDSSIYLLERDIIRIPTRQDLEQSVADGAHIAPYGGILTFDPIPSMEYSDRYIDFSGRLTTPCGHGAPGKTIHTVFSMHLISDAPLNTMETDPEGYFYGQWRANGLLSQEWDFYMEFQGDSQMGKAKSIEHTIKIR